MTAPAFAANRPPDEPLLRVRDLTVRFGRAAPVLHEVSFDLPPLALLGLLPEHARVTGSVTFRGQELLGRSDRELSRLRGSRLGMVFQEPMTALDPTMTVGRQLAEVVRLHRGAATGRTRSRVLELLAEVDLKPPGPVADRFPFQLSGGQRQRVVLAMALANAPDLVICDEPTTALDVTVQARVLDLLDASLRRTAAGCLFISHDLAVVAQVCQDVLVLLDGRVVDRGPVQQLFRRPAHAYTAGLVATARLDRYAVGQRLPTLADFYAPDGSSP